MSLWAEADASAPPIRSSTLAEVQVPSTTSVSSGWTAWPSHSPRSTDARVPLPTHSGSTAPTPSPDGRAPSPPRAPRSSARSWEAVRQCSFASPRRRARRERPPGCRRTIVAPLDTQGQWNDVRVLLHPASVGKTHHELWRSKERIAAGSRTTTHTGACTTSPPSGSPATTCVSSSTTSTSTPVTPRALPSSANPGCTSRRASTTSPSTSSEEPLQLPLAVRTPTGHRRTCPQRWWRSPTGASGRAHALRRIDGRHLRTMRPPADVLRRWRCSDPSVGPAWARRRRPQASTQRAGAAPSPGTGRIVTGSARLVAGVAP